MPEVWVLQVRYKAYGLAGRLHFGPELLIYFRELIKRKNRLLDGITPKLAFDSKILKLVNAQHYLSGNVNIRNIVRFRDKRDRTRCTRISFDHVNLIVFYCKLDVEKAQYI